MIGAVGFFDEDLLMLISVLYISFFFFSFSFFLKKKL